MRQNQQSLITTRCCYSFIGWGAIVILIWNAALLRNYRPANLHHHQQDSKKFSSSTSELGQLKSNNNAIRIASNGHLNLAQNIPIVGNAPEVPATPIISVAPNDPKEDQHPQSELKMVSSERFSTTQADTHATAVDEPEMHIIFSTDCTFYQDYQSIIIFHSAMAVKQKGQITRIASGCEESKQAELTALYRKLYPQYHVHFTPNFKMDAKTKKEYDFYNKPYGVEHWIQFVEPPIKDGVIVALIDPDFIFLRPLTSQIKGADNNIYLRLSSIQDLAEDAIPRVSRGHPAGQLYGLGAPWTFDHHRHFNRTHICGEGSPCLKVTSHFGERHYSLGPPYILEKEDLHRLVHKWTEFVPRVYEKYPYLLAEMYAYSMAAAHENLPHVTMEHYMVSDIGSSDEGWAWVEAHGDDVCQPPVDGIYMPGKPLPTFLHYCQFFRIGELGFHKRRVKPSFFSCEHPLFREPPLEVAKLTYKNRDGEIVPLSRRDARRNAFMVCVIHRSMNAAIADFKLRNCEPGRTVNLNKTINIVELPF